MNREPSFPFDWIQPGEYRYCSCGIVLVPPGVIMCAKCRYKPKLEDGLCFCGQTASMFFVHGFRCAEHAFQEKPSQAQITDKMTITVGCMKPRPNREAEMVEIAECERMHGQLKAERDELADNRRKDGYKPLFWLENAT